MTLYTKLFNYTYGYKPYKPRKEEELIIEELEDGDFTFTTKPNEEEEPETIRFNEEKYNDIINTDDNDEYISWKMFDKIPERVYKISYEGLTDEKGNIESSGIYDDEQYGKRYIKRDDKGRVILSMKTNEYEFKQPKRTIKTKKFICEAPIAAGKSTALRKWLFSRINPKYNEYNKFIVIVPTVNIAEEFYNKLSALMKDVVEPLNEGDNAGLKGFIKLCVKDDAFSDFINAVKTSVNIVITTFSTASKCLGDLVEEYYEQKERLDYFLLIDEAHLLLNYISLIELTKEFDKVGLISATAEDIKHFACFKDYMVISPEASIEYDRTIYIKKLMNDADEQRKALIDLVDKVRPDYDKILIKIEDKKECRLLKDLLSHKYKVVLYNADDKETVLNDNGHFECNESNESIDIIISTSSIQNGQTIKDNILLIFVQTYLDTISSVKQFLGRNRNKISDAFIFVRYGKQMKKKNYAIMSNRYERYLMKLRNKAYNEMKKYDWEDELKDLGHVLYIRKDNVYTMIIDASESSEDFVAFGCSSHGSFRGSESLEIDEYNNESSNEIINDIVTLKNIDEKLINIKDSINEVKELLMNERVNEDVKENINDVKEFSGKKELYEYYNINKNTIPEGYEITMKYIRTNGKKGRVYKLIKT